MPIRRIARGAARALARAGRYGPLRRHLLRIRFGPWAHRWLAGRAIIRWRDVDVEVDPGEAHGFHVFVHGDYGGAELDACIALCRRARVFVDVGAHIGLISLAVARACPGVRVVAVEADPDIAAWFRRNLALNPGLAPRVTLVEAAATDRDGLVAFTASAAADNVGMGHVTTDAAAVRTLPAIALGGWLRARDLAADVVKMDVEGAELPALEGLWSAGEWPPAILLETHGYMAADPAAFNRRLLTELTRRQYLVSRLSRGDWSAVSDPTQLGDRSHLRALRPPG